MLVFLSDLHMTDGSLGENINPGAFAKFTRELEGIGGHWDSIEIVLLGDILDVLRSNQWLRSRTRPWSEGKINKRRVISITKAIYRNQANRECMAHLLEFKEKMKMKGVRVKMTYIVGNHDALINDYPETRVRAARFLGLATPGRYKAMELPREKHWPGYSAVARHGDIYDPFASVGCPIVTDLANKFPGAVEKEIGRNTDPLLISRLYEIDNVYPLLDIPLWIHSVCRASTTPEIEKKTKRVWQRLVDEFLQLDIIRQQDRPWRIDIVDALHAGLKITKHVPTRYLAELPLRKFVPKDDEYAEHALSESYRPHFVLYGHTHSHKIIPLGYRETGNPGRDRYLKRSGLCAGMAPLYINTGTWRKVQVKAIRPPHFASWHVMTFVVLYARGEHEYRRFEVWNGALG